MMRQSLHVHSTLDDGKSTMEEMVLSAIENGLESIGFSGHSPLPFGEDWTMSQDDLKAYHKEIDRLRKEYSEIKIYRGLELDTFSEKPEGEYDYIIGSCHNLNVNGYIFSVDETREILIDAIENHFDGNPAALAKAYFNEVAKAEGDIQGHFDLLTKFNEKGDIFIEKDYLQHALSVLEYQNRKGLIFEINTGAMSRGYRSQPYPSQEILYGLKKLDGRITITSDCHNAKDIAYAYEEAEYYAKDSGFREIWLYNGEKFEKERI